MGFFSFFRDTASKIGSAIGKGVEFVGRTLKIETVENFGRSLDEFCESFRQAPSYDKKTASATETADINYLLVTFGADFEKKADELEEDALYELRQYFSDLITEIEQSDMKISTKRLRRSLTISEKQVQGKLKRFMARRLSIDDMECLHILSLPPGDEKSREMNKFGEKVLVEALEQLADDVIIFVEEQNEVLEEAMRELMEQQTTSVTEKVRQLSSILEKSDGELFDREGAKLKPAILLRSMQHLQAELA
ncbi:hypothetical protein [Exiguobacterium sp. S22-S28]|uniref:hypothetical protein n=1 Tax=Exiguobacterium sp. S22-S28 TaxID=3342768 RepID=UPI00372D0AAF